MQVFDRVLQQLHAWDAPYRIIEHEAVWTCETMARYCDCSAAEIIKSVVMEATSKRLLVYILPGDKRVESRHLRRHLGEKNVRFANKERAEQACGCGIGCIPPFGHATPLAAVINARLFDNPHGYLSPGRHDRSIRIPMAILERIERASMVDAPA